MRVERWTSVYELRELNHRAEGFPMHQIKMIFSGKQLQDPWCLGGQGIVEGSLVHMVSYCIIVVFLFACASSSSPRVPVTRTVGVGGWDGGRVFGAPFVLTPNTHPSTAATTINTATNTHIIHQHHHQHTQLTDPTQTIHIRLPPTQEQEQEQEPTSPPPRSPGAADAHASAASSSSSSSPREEPVPPTVGFIL